MVLYKGAVYATIQRPAGFSRSSVANREGGPDQRSGRRPLKELTKGRPEDLLLPVKEFPASLWQVTIPRLIQRLVPFSS